MKLLALLALLAPASAADSGSSCLDSTSWHKNGNTAKDCEWVSRHMPQRCTVRGPDKVLASEECAASCGSCRGPYGDDLYSAASENPCADAPLKADLPNLPCIEAAVQSATDVTVGAVGLLDAALDPVPDYNAAGMCTVNVHWHIGAEHRSEGERVPAASAGIASRARGPPRVYARYDETCDFEHRRLATHEPSLRGAERRLAADGRVGHMCCNAKELHDADDPLVANEYDWKYCQDMHVGMSYELHWPHSSLGHCQSEWQFQEPFMDGVLCKATIGGLDIATAVDALMDRAASVGVEGQVFTIVNSDDPTSSDYLRPTWDALNGWDADLATDRAYYQGSTTGDAANNDDQCRGTGGVVTWHVDRECHLLEAATMDNLCRLMFFAAGVFFSFLLGLATRRSRRLVVPSDDLSADVAPHGARETVTPELSDTPYTP